MNSETPDKFKIKLKENKLKYQCDKCDEKLSTASNLSRHKKKWCSFTKNMNPNTQCTQSTTNNNVLNHNQNTASNNTLNNQNGTINSNVINQGTIIINMNINNKYQSNLTDFDIHRLACEEKDKDWADNYFMYKCLSDGNLLTSITKYLTGFKDIYGPFRLSESKNITIHKSPTEVLIDTDGKQLEKIAKDILVDAIMAAFNGLTEVSNLSADNIKYGELASSEKDPKLREKYEKLANDAHDKIFKGDYSNLLPSLKEYYDMLSKVNKAKVNKSMRKSFTNELN